MRNNVEHLLNRFKGDGPYLYIDNAKLIDAASGTFNLPLGYTNERITNKLSAQLARGAHLSSAYTLEMAQSILGRLLPYAPAGFTNIWLRDVTGSGAVECAIRMAQKATGRSGVMSLYMSHHGQSLATAQISGNAFRIKDFHVEITGSVKIPVPPSVLANQIGDRDLHEFADLDALFEFGLTQNIACVIVEPVLGNGGNIVIPKAFYSHLNKFCRRNNIVIVADEVQTGFGRTGTFFASTGYARDLDPDIIVFAKGAGGIGIPTGGVLMRKELDVLESFEHSSTSGANPLSLIAMNETISIIEDEDLLGRVTENQDFILNGLIDIQSRHSSVSGVRGLGYMFGFDTPSPEFAKQFIDLAHKNGLIIRGSRYGKSSALKVRPPLICTRLHIDEILQKIDLTLNQISAQ
ncbi:MULTISPECIES: aspartate aminotransferase family protein [unclassified Pseudomonas]|uniref:class-III pyridoxal-phosphate-dependent aminotransferase n=1 Tax=unclassified Pseudomonas TaxID=196821 RepID=UPI001A9CF489|nr:MULTISPECIES: aspartate aminotransferase family protein [unclassified Pseudomonas]